MATASQANALEAPREQVVVLIGLDQDGEIVVHPKKFWVHKSENDEVEWFCFRKHDHNDPDDACFTVNFNKNGSPFSTSTFTSDHPRSGLPVVGPSPREYGYTVTVGLKTLDPGGGVKG
jgi:hypothetical protein